MTETTDGLRLKSVRKRICKGGMHPVELVVLQSELVIVSIQEQVYATIEPPFDAESVDPETSQDSEHTWLVVKGYHDEARLSAIADSIAACV